MEFSSLEQRMAQTFIDMFPKFVPDENAPVSIAEQKEFYQFIIPIRVILTLAHLLLLSPLLQGRLICHPDF
jgi:hypothetical protein